MTWLRAPAIGDQITFFHLRMEDSHSQATGESQPFVGGERGSQGREKNWGETQAAPSTIRPQELVWSEMDCLYQSEYSHRPLGVQHIRKLGC